jgi:hypothetical protein
VCIRGPKRLWLGFKRELILNVIALARRDSAPGTFFSRSFRFH